MYEDGPHTERVKLLYKTVKQTNLYFVPKTKRWIVKSQPFELIIVFFLFY